jgi:hypothetical protein
MRYLIILALTVGMGFAAKSPFAGVWEGSVNDLPGVEIMIRDNGGELSGNVGFYFQKRANESEKWHVDSKTTLAMLAVKIEGNVLSFETIHHKTHDSPELGPNVKFQMELTGANEAVFRKVEGGEAGHGLKLTRRVSR